MKAYFHSLSPKGTEELEGGRGQASGFIMRAMAENKKKHSGQYKNPTYPLAPGSTMNKPIEFDWKKLANKNQGGEKDVGSKTHWGNKGEYGASPFILHHFSGSTKEYKKGNKVYPKESDIQQKARMIFSAKNLLAKAKKLAVATGTQAPTLQISELTPSVVPQATKADIIEHFGNVAEKAETAEKANEPPTPKTEIVETAPPAPKPVVEPVVAKKSKKPKVAESPTPPNPVPRVVWSEEELKSNPLTREETANYYADLDNRQQKLFIFALNNPKAKLGDAVKYLKDNGIGKGFSPPTISPIYKEMRKEADEVLADEEKRNKTLSNPAFTAIKEKLDALMVKKGDKPLEVLKNAFKGIDVEMYLETYNGIANATDDVEPYNLDKKLAYRDEGKWLLFGGKKHGKTSVPLSKKLFDSGLVMEKEKANITFGEHPHQYGKPTYWATWKAKFDVKDKAGNIVPTDASMVIGGLHMNTTTKRYQINDDNITLYVGSKDFKDPDETPSQRIHNISEGNSGRFPRYEKARSKIFQQKELYIYEQSYWVGYYLTEWYYGKSQFRDPTVSEKRTRKIGLARNIKRIVKTLETNDFQYTMMVNGVEYICPPKDRGENDPDESPEDRKDPVAPGEEPPELPEKGKWSLDNIDTLGEETENYVKGDLSPTEQKLVLWHLNNTLEFSMNSPEIPEGRGRATDLRKEIASAFKEAKEKRKEWLAKKDIFDRSNSKKKTGGYVLNKISDADAKNPDEIRLLPIKNKVRYQKTKEALLEALSNYTVPPVASRANLLGTESGMMAGKKSGDGIVARGVAFGFGNNRRGFDYYVKNKNNPEVYKALVDFGEAIVPKGWDFQTIQLNHNAKAKKHRDKNNVGKSVIIGIGDYNGGELRVWDKEDDKHKDYNIKDRPTMFNGALLSHETQPFSNPTDYEAGKGRYTIVYFRHKYKPDRGNVGVGSGLHDIETMVGKGMKQPTASALEDLFV